MQQPSGPLGLQRLTGGSDFAIGLLHWRQTDQVSVVVSGINYTYSDNFLSEIWPVMCLVNEWLCTAVTIEWMTQPIRPPSRDYWLPIWRNRITFHLRQTDSNWVSEQTSVQRRASGMTVPSPSKATRTGHIEAYSCAAASIAANISWI